MKEVILTDKAQQPGGMPYSQAMFNFSKKMILL